MKPINKKISIPEAYNDLLCVARMVVDWYEGRLFNGPDERKALYEAAKAALPQANAAAIAALPDLLAEREKMIAALMAISSRDPMSAVCGDDPKLCKLQCFGCMARSVLAEAEGGE